MKKALVLASVASMIDQFNMPNIKLLMQLGYEVDVVANFKQSGSISLEKAEKVKKNLQTLGVNVIHCPIPRRIVSLKKVIKSYTQVKKLVTEKRYALVHCHSPIGGVVARLASKKARKKYGTKVIYTAHGFHFYKGAPMLNWLLFYPIEKHCSRFTDILITINKEDYAFARKKMLAKTIEYLPGVGVDLSTFTSIQENGLIIEKKRALNLSEHDILLLSVGEINDNKNHEVVIRALAQLRLEYVKYIVVGKGELLEKLQMLVNELGLQNNVAFLGYCEDVVSYYKLADIFVFPSRREGLSVALMEAMASGLPCVVSKIRGNVDLIEQEQGGLLCAPTDVGAFADAIDVLVKQQEKRIKLGKYNQKKVQMYSIETVLTLTRQFYLM